MNTKLHAICDSLGRPINRLITAGQVSNYIGARALVSSLPKVEWLLGVRGYDADWFREALERQRHTRIHPLPKTTDGIRQIPLSGRCCAMPCRAVDKRRYKPRNRPSRLCNQSVPCSDRDHIRRAQGLATRYDRWPKVFLSATALAATVIFWL